MSALNGSDFAAADELATASTTALAPADTSRLLWQWAVSMAMSTTTTTRQPPPQTDEIMISSPSSPSPSSLASVSASALSFTAAIMLNDTSTAAENDIGSIGGLGGGLLDPSSYSNVATLFADALLNSTNATQDAHGAATETPYVPYYSRPETYIVPVLFALIFIVGVLGNGTLIAVFLGVRQMRNVPNTYILSLALADMLVIVTTVPLTSTLYTIDSWPWGSFLCTLSEFVKDVSIGVSVFTLTALSGDRYFAIVDPLRKFHAHGGGKRATRTTLGIAVSIWFLAIICGLPALIGTYLKKVDINSNKSFLFCYPFPEKWGVRYAKTMVLLRFLVYYAIPLIIIAVFYVLIALHLVYAARVPGEAQGAVRQVRARRKVAVTVLAFVVIFGICFLPYHVFMLWFYYWPTAEEDYNAFWHVLRILGFCLSFANSCANPVALYFVSGAFRKHFNRYLFCREPSTRRHKRHPHNETFCMHRNTSLTSTASKRFNSRHSCYQSTLRSSRLQETTITTLPNGGLNGCLNADITLATTENAENNIEFSLMSDFRQQQQQQQQQVKILQRAQRSKSASAGVLFK